MVGSLLVGRRLCIKYRFSLLLLTFVVFLSGTMCIICSFIFWSPGSEMFASKSHCQDEAELAFYESRLLQLQLRLTKLQRQLKTQLPESATDVKDLSEGIFPTIYVITPTYARPVQKAELTRLVSTFLHVQSLHWIVVEDAENTSTLVHNLLEHSGLTYTHLYQPTPKNYKIKDEDRLMLPEKYRASESDISWLKPRGVLQRNKALHWIRSNLQSAGKGVVYFADDDNTYDIRLFQEMRDTQTVSVWPVGLAGGLMVERPVLNSAGKVTAWQTLWKPERPFALDMAGFAVNLQLLLLHPEAKFNIRGRRGYQESILLTTLVTLNDLEPKAANCTRVYVWHTRTQDVKLNQELKLEQLTGMRSDHSIEV